MYEVSCASCQTSFEYNIEDYIHLCPFCSAGFIIDTEEGSKDLIGDHYIVPSRLHSDQIQKIFVDWIGERYHRPDKIKNEFNVLGYYGVMLPYWIISLEAHTYWSGHSAKEKIYPGQSHELAARFVKEEGRFSRRYRWAILARKSPKEHWGLERLHKPKEAIIPDWDGFPLDETMGIADEGDPPIYDAKMAFKFEHTGNLTLAGIQVRESQAIMRARDQIMEYHRRIAKTKIGSLYEHRTEVEVIGIHVVHIPFWLLRYSFTPKSFFRLFTTARERRILVQGYTKAVLDAELPLSASDKVLTNLVLCGALAFICLILTLFFNFMFFFLFLLFVLIATISGWKILKKEKKELDFMKMESKKEMA